MTGKSWSVLGMVLAMIGAAEEGAAARLLCPDAGADERASREGSRSEADPEGCPSENPAG